MKKNDYIICRTFGHPLAHSSERPSVLDAEWDVHMQRQVDAIFEEDTTINWWKVIAWTVAVGGCLVFWYQVLALFDWW